LSFDRQARILGFGYLARRKSFKRLNHALQLVFVNLIAKADINTQVLSLRRGAPKDFNSTYLMYFKREVLCPLIARLYKSYYELPELLTRESKVIFRNAKPEDRRDLQMVWMALYNEVVPRRRMTIDSMIRELGLPSPVELSTILEVPDESGLVS